MTRATLMRGLGAVAIALATVSLGQAQSPADFYKGKTVELYVGYSVGGGYDTYARTIARHIGKHIPGNPTVVVKNMPGAGSVRLANWLYNVAPKDGTVFGTVGRGVAFDPLLGSKGAQFDAGKFTWIGSANNEVSTCVVWHTSPVKKFEDLFTKEVTVGGTGAASDTDQFPKVLNAAFGTKIKVISGYPGGNDVALAMERGEVQGRCAWSWSSLVSTHKHWVDQKKITILVQLALKKHPDIANAPLVMDFAKTDEQKRILRLVFARQVMGRPYLAPPGLPKDRAASLRGAFETTMMDEAFLADAKKSRLGIVLVTGQEIEELIGEVYKTPKDIVKKVSAMIRKPKKKKKK
jgi:tripartite-type tricarboxylate transporter receptor subunit TctC